MTSTDMRTDAVEQYAARLRTVATTPPAGTCPTWCADRDRPGHWNRNRDSWEAIHTRKFGPVAVYLLEELTDNEPRWIGTCEVSLTDRKDPAPDLDPESITATAAADLAHHLTAAARFALRVEQESTAAEATSAGADR